MASRLACLWLLVCWLAGEPGRADTIAWFSAAGSTNLTSTNLPINAVFNFELGVFRGGFVPDAGNTAQWADYWVPAQRVSYNADNKFFTGQFTVVDNTAPFTIGTPAYIWGFQGSSPTAEWILLSNATWTWPAAGVMNPLALNWDASTATAVLGAIDTDGSPFLMQSAALPDTTASWEQWRLAELAGEPLSGPEDDPDHDGTPNLLEFVFGTLPKVAGAQVVTPLEIVTIFGQRFLQITIPRMGAHPATLDVQVSSNLISWDTGPDFTMEVSNTPTALVVRDLTPLGPGVPQRFMRLKAGLPAP